MVSFKISHVLGITYRSQSHPSLPAVNQRQAMRNESLLIVRHCALYMLQLTLLTTFGGKYHELRLQTRELNIETKSPSQSPTHKKSWGLGARDTSNAPGAYRGLQTEKGRSCCHHVGSGNPPEPFQRLLQPRSHPRSAPDHAPDGGTQRSRSEARKGAPPAPRPRHLPRY